MKNETIPETKPTEPTQRIHRAFSRAADRYEGAGQMQDYAAGCLAELFRRSLGGEKPRRVLEIGAGSGFLTRRLCPEVLPGGVYTANDLTESFAHRYRSWGCVPLVGDVLQVALPQGQDAVVSSSCFQWIADLSGLFRRLAACLTEGGVLCFSTFGPEHFLQVKSLTGVGLEYPSPERIVGELLGAGFEVEESLREKDLLRFDTAWEMLRYFSATGVNGIARPAEGIWTPGRLQDFERRYRQRYTASPGDPLPLTVDYLWFSARKRR